MPVGSGTVTRSVVGPTNTALVAGIQGDEVSTVGIASSTASARVRGQPMVTPPASSPILSRIGSPMTMEPEVVV